MNLGEIVFRDIIIRAIRKYQREVEERLKAWEHHANNLTQQRNQYLSDFQARDADYKRALAAFQECRDLYHACHAEVEQMSTHIERLEDETYEQYIELNKAEDSYNRVLFNYMNQRDVSDEKTEKISKLEETIRELENQVAALKDEVKKYKPDAKWDF